MSSLQPMVDAGEALASVAPSGSARAVRDGDFRALLTPHRALGPQGFAILLSALCALCAGTAAVFLMSGAWPVLAFLTLDVALLALAWQINDRISRLHETVQLTEDALLVKRTYPSGKQADWSFHPYWVRLAVEENDTTGRVELKLNSHGRELIIGHFMSDEDKYDFADALAGALRDYRAGTAPD